MTEDEILKKQWELIVVGFPALYERYHREEQLGLDWEKCMSAYIDDCQEVLAEFIRHNGLNNK